MEEKTYNELLLDTLCRIAMTLEGEHDAALVNHHLSLLLDNVAQMRSDIKEHVDEIAKYSEAQCSAYRMAIDAVYAVIDRAQKQVGVQS